MAKDKLTLQQRNAVDSYGAVLVSAAAGSGKTSVLTEKVVDLLVREDNPCDADRLLVVTFTNAAAAEMRSRIESRLNEECEKDPSNKRLLRQKVLLAHSSVCTIDSFCMDLVKENFYDLQIDPDFNIVNGGTFEEWKNSAVSQILNEEYNADPEGFGNVLNAIGSKFGDDKLKDAIIKLYNFTRALQDPEQWMKNVLDFYSSAKEFKENIWAKAAFKRLNDRLDDFIPGLDAAVRKVAELTSADDRADLVSRFLLAYSENISTLGNISAFIKAGEWDRAYKCLGSIQIIKLNGLSALEQGEMNKARAAQLISVFQDKLKELSDELSNVLYDCEENVISHLERDSETCRFLINSAIRAEGMLFEKCRENSMFTFDMIEHMALSLLKSAAGTEISGRYDWVLVDEYQDVNELQGTIFSMLSRADERLFAVGDVKQSIYGFRQADPKMFLDRKDSYADYDGETYPSKVVLDANFRSRSGVCDFVNFCFSRLMKKETCGMDYLLEDHLVSKADFAEREENDVKVYIADTDCYDTSARAVADYIAESINNGMMVGKRGEERKARFSDFAVLMRAPSTHISKYIQAFSEAGIPVSTEKDGFWECGEIIAVCSALRAISNPCDDISLLALLSSYPDGFNPDELATLRIEAGDKNAPLYIALCDAAERGDEKSAFAKNKIEEFRRIAASNSITTVLNLVMDWLDIFNFVKFSEDAGNKSANLLRLISVASEYEKGENVDLQSFCAYIRRNAEGSEDKSAMAPSGADAVKIMSIHKSKGLQFPVCIIAEADARFNVMDSYGSVIMHETFGVAVDYFDMVECTKSESLAKRVISSEIKKKNIAEELRLLYVAMTRAEDRLVFFAGSGKPKEELEKVFRLISFSSPDSPLNSSDVFSASSYAKWIYMCIYNHPELFEELLPYSLPFKEKSAQNHSGVDFEVLDYPEEATIEKKDKTAAEPSKEIVEKIKGNLEYKYPFEDLLDIAAKSSVSALSKGENQIGEFSDTPSFLSGTMLTPAQRGTALHKFMQFCRFSNCEKNVAEEADRLEDMEFITETERLALDEKLLEKFFGSELYRRIKNSPKVMREQRFLSSLPVAKIKEELADRFPEETIVVQGAADCIFIENDSLVILDFKSDRVKNADELKARYAAQLDIYAKAFAEIYNMPVKEKVIYSFKLGEAISLFD